MKTDIKLNTEEMAQAGVNFGHKASKLHPNMKQYVTGTKNDVHVFDLEKTSKQLEKALEFIGKLASEGKKMLFVGTKIQLRGLIKITAEECEMPYVVERWLGGTFTNFETIQKRVEYFKDLEKKKAAGELEKYTKKERMNIDKELESLRIKFEGIKNMSKLPDAAVIFNLDKDITCVREAKIKDIKIVAIADTNVDPELADYPIPANDDAISSVKYMLDRVKESIINSKQSKS